MTVYHTDEQSEVKSKERGGFTQIDNDFIDNAGELSHGAFRLYLILRRIAWQDGFCYPGQERLAAMMGVSSLRTVYKYAEELRDAGLIFIVRRPLDHGKNRTNVYTFTDYSQPLSQGTDEQELADPDSPPADSAFTTGRFCLDRQELTDPDRYTLADDEYAADEDTGTANDSSFQSESLAGDPPKTAVAEEETPKKEKPRARRGLSATSSRGGQPTPQKAGQRGAGKDRSCVIFDPDPDEVDLDDGFTTVGEVMEDLEAEEEAKLVPGLYEDFLKDF